MVVNPATDEFAEGIGVTILQGELPMTDRRRREMVASIGDRFTSTGIRLSGLDSEIVRIANRRWMVWEFTMHTPAGRIHQWQYSTPGDGVTYLLTGTSLPEDAIRYRALYDRVAATFELPQGNQEFWKTYPRLTRSAIVAGVLALFWLLVGSRVTQRSKTNDDVSPPPLP